jgi:hypothetical protein
MSKIFEALQLAQTERRMQLDKLARQVPTDPRGDTRVLRQAPVLETTTERTEGIACNVTQALAPAPVPEVRMDRAERTACDCEQYSRRIGRRGIWDSLLGLLGLYPWKCSQCNRHFHRLRRC